AVLSLTSDAFLYLCLLDSLSFLFFFSIDTSTPSIYTLSLHDALPISVVRRVLLPRARDRLLRCRRVAVVALLHHSWTGRVRQRRSEEHTSELQSRGHLVCRLLLEKKNKITITSTIAYKSEQ